MFAGGLRIGGFDGNTLYNSTNPIGITALNNINLLTGTSLANYAIRLSVDTNGVVNIGNNLTGAPNVCKRALFTFTPVYTSIPPSYYYYINVNNYISSISGGSNEYIFRITIWHTSGDFGDTGTNVESMQYVVFLSDYSGGKCRLYQIFNSSSSAYLTWYSSGNQLYFYAGNNNVTRFCCIENIGAY